MKLCKNANMVYRFSQSQSYTVVYGDLYGVDRRNFGGKVDTLNAQT